MIKSRSTPFATRLVHWLLWLQLRISVYIDKLYTKSNVYHCQVVVERVWGVGVRGQGEEGLELRSLWYSFYMHTHTPLWKIPFHFSFPILLLLPLFFVITIDIFELDKNKIIIKILTRIRLQVLYITVFIIYIFLINIFYYKAIVIGFIIQNRNTLGISFRFLMHSWTPQVFNDVLPFAAFFFCEPV